MSAPSKGIEEYVLHLDGMERCPECGFVWNDTSEGHFHDCRYYVLQDQDEVFWDEVPPLDLPVVIVVRHVRGKDRRHRS